MLECGVASEPSFDMDRSCHFSSCTRVSWISIPTPQPSSWDQQRSCEQLDDVQDGGRERGAQSCNRPAVRAPSRGSSSPKPLAYPGSQSFRMTNLTSPRLTFPTCRRPTPSQTYITHPARSTQYPPVLEVCRKKRLARFSSATFHVSSERAFHEIPNRRRAGDAGVQRKINRVDQLCSGRIVPLVPSSVVPERRTAPLTPVQQCFPVLYPAL